MVRIAHTMVLANGEVHTHIKHVDRFTPTALRQMIGWTEQPCEMDTIDESQRDYGVIKFIVAQSRPWTYNTHVFVRTE